MCRFATTFTPTLLLPFGQNSGPSPAGVDARVETQLKHLTLEERLLGGVDDVFIRGNKTFGLPCLKMADGPVGVHTCGPAATLGGVGLAPTWDPDLVTDWVL
jgi:hypothetical protein